MGGLGKGERRVARRPSRGGSKSGSKSRKKAEKRKFATLAKLAAAEEMDLGKASATVMTKAASRGTTKVGTLNSKQKASGTGRLTVSVAKSPQHSAPADPEVAKLVEVRHHSLLWSLNTRSCALVGLFLTTLVCLPSANIDHPNLDPVPIGS
jgi:hypothetical protein